MSCRGQSFHGRKLANQALIWTLHRSRANFLAMAKGATVNTDKSEVLQGTLDLMILKTLHALGHYMDSGLHGASSR